VQETVAILRKHGMIPDESSMDRPINQRNRRL
jgi:hypothetical protein